MIVVSNSQSRIPPCPKNAPTHLGSSGRFIQTVANRLTLSQYHPAFVMNSEAFQAVNPRFTNHLG
jgi:hypothetical protein